MTNLLQSFRPYASQTSPPILHSRFFCSSSSSLLFNFHLSHIVHYFLFSVILIIFLDYLSCWFYIFLRNHSYFLSNFVTFSMFLKIFISHVSIFRLNLCKGVQDRIRKSIWALKNKANENNKITIIHFIRLINLFVNDSR